MNSKLELCFNNNKQSREDLPDSKPLSRNSSMMLSQEERDKLFG
ncbi:4117_t:CDS:1, partial [Dentiscutata heterogama]